MKKSIISIIIFLTFLGITANSVYAQNITTNENEQQTYTLDELLKDEKEQEEIRKLLEEAPIPNEEQETKEEKAVLTTSEDVTYTSPSDAGSTSYLKGTDIPGYDYYINESTSQNTTTKVTKCYFKIYKHDVMNNKNSLIYDATSDNAHYITYHVRDNILYILYITDYDMSNAWLTEYSTSCVVGIDLKTEKTVMKQQFACPQDCGYFPSFAVDGEQRVYLPYSSTGLKVFDKTGKLVYDHSPIENSSNKYFNYIKGVSPNNKVLLFEVMYRSYEPYAYAQTVYEGMQKLDNGVFVYKDSYTVYGRTYPNNWSYNPRWHFLDSNGTYAADQYGRIAKFDYDAPTTDTQKMGVDREFVLDLSSSAVDYGNYAGTPYYPNVCKNGNYVYIVGGSNNNIYKVNINTFEYSEYLTTGIEKYSNIKSINYYEQSIFVLYQPSWKYQMMQIKLDSSNFEKIQNIVISDNITTSHTIADIVAKYKATMPKFNYSSSIYKVNPTWKSPYVAGSLKDQVVTDTVNRLNYFRWLVGVDEITVNTAKLDRNQKGAVISKANNTISHYPTQPSDMLDDFYNEAYDGCNAKYEEGDTYSGNVSYGDYRPYQAIEGFVSDLNNVSFGSATGHRQSMLDPKATSISFGQCAEYSTASVFYDSEKDVATSQYYAFPSAGYFPNTEMKINEYWSIYFTGEVLGSVKANFIYNGKTYAATGLLFENGYPVLSFKMPEELQNALGGANNNIPGETKIQVEVLGLKDEDLNNITYKYQVNFFDMVSEMPSKQDIESLTFDYKFYADKYPDLKKVYGYDEAKLKNHWLTKGIKEGRQASPILDLKYYITNNADLKKAYGTDYTKAYNHFINTGWAELRPTSNEYCGGYYKTAYSDLNEFSAYKLMKHYITKGKAEGRKATNVIDLTPIDIKQYLFNATIYANTYADLKKAYGTDVTKLSSHWRNKGIKEGRVASLVFDAKYYLEKYPDLKKAYGTDYTKAYNHFVTKGINEGRQASKNFNVKVYLQNNADLNKAYGDNYSVLLKHFVQKGCNENRKAV